MSSKESGGPFSLEMVLLCCLSPLGIYMILLCVSAQVPTAAPCRTEMIPSCPRDHLDPCWHVGETVKKGIKCQTEGGGGNKIQWETAEGIPLSEEKEEVLHGKGCIPCSLWSVPCWRRWMFPEVTAANVEPRVEQVCPDELQTLGSPYWAGKKYEQKGPEQKPNKQTWRKRRKRGMNYSKWFPREGKINLFNIDPENLAVYWDFLPG